MQWSLSIKAAKYLYHSKQSCEGQSTQLSSESEQWDQTSSWAAYRDKQRKTGGQKGSLNKFAILNKEGM